MSGINVYFDLFYDIIVRIGGLSNSGQQINMVQCDTGAKLTFFLKDCGGNVIADGVSGVDFFLKSACGGCPNAGHTAVSGINVSGGVWRYFFQEGDLSGVGTIFGDVQVTFDDGTHVTGFDSVRILVRRNNKCCGDSNCSGCC